MANEEHLAILRQGVDVWNQRRADLREADLRGANLTRTDLTRADLREADLRGADLGGANLTWANLSGADLSGATLWYANLTWANINTANLRAANLMGADLRGARLSGANLTRANLMRANLSGARLSGANLSGARLSGANLMRANLSGTRLSGANLMGTDLSGADLRGARLSGANLKMADLSGAIIWPDDLNGVELDGVDLSRVDRGRVDQGRVDRGRVDQDWVDQDWGVLHSRQPFDIEKLEMAKITMSDSAESRTIGKSLESSRKTIERFPHVSLQNKVPLGQICTLRVAVTQQPLRKELEKEAMRLEVPDGVESIKLDVLVTAEDFDIDGNNYRALIVPVAKDSEPILFQMTPQSVGEKKVKVEFFQDNRYVGGVIAATTVVPLINLSDIRQVIRAGSVELTKQGFPADLTILITESKSDTGHMRYSFKLHSPINGLYYYTVREELNFSGSPSKWMEGLYRELGQLSRGRNLLPIGTKKRKAIQNDIAGTLSTIGANLYENLFPRELKEIWKNQIRYKVKSIMIISDEPWIPWEMIKPFYETETGEIVEDPFLSENYWLTRWLAGPPPLSFIEISSSALIAPAGDLPNVQREAEFLKGRGATEIEPTLASVRQLLRQGGFELLHFACHGSFDPDEHEQAIVYLNQGDKFKSRDVTGDRKNFGKNKPFVFINACQTARGDFSLVGIGSWAHTFINTKASSFLGTSWEVNDELAYRFSIIFYSALSEGKPIGEAMLLARLAIQSESDPTWLAYTLYADPLAICRFT